MYEMYPDAWAVADDRQPATTAIKPRRRARKEHSVVPAVLVAVDSGARPTGDRGVSPLLPAGARRQLRPLPRSRRRSRWSSGAARCRAAMSASTAFSTRAASSEQTEMIEQQSHRQDGGGRVGDALPGDVGRGAVHRLEHRRVRCRSG